MIFIACKTVAFSTWNSAVSACITGRTTHNFAQDLLLLYTRSHIVFCSSLEMVLFLIGKDFDTYLAEALIWTLVILLQLTYNTLCWSNLLNIVLSQIMDKSSCSQAPFTLSTLDKCLASKSHCVVQMKTDACHQWKVEYLPNRC